MRLSRDTPPKSSRTCAPKWYDVPDEKWFDWRWQLANRLNSVEELGEVIRLTESEKQALSATTISSEAGKLTIHFSTGDSQFNALLQSPLFRGVVR